ncbi:hypothetical protein F8M41_015691, partial [Gigaspora margarita]
IIIYDNVKGEWSNKTSTLPTNWTADITPLVYIPGNFCLTQTGKVPPYHIHIISLENETYEWISEGGIFPLVIDPNEPPPPQGPSSTTSYLDPIQ